MATITTRAAVAHGPHQDWELTELQLDDPKEHEVRVKLAASGLCHSDRPHHRRRRAGPVPDGRWPRGRRHRGVRRPERDAGGVGDRVVLSYIPACGACRPCSTGHQNMCVKGLNAGTGMFLDGTFRFHRGDEDFGGFCSLGTFSEYAVVSEWAAVPLPDDIPFQVAALVGCGVPTGWGSAVYAAGVRAGDTVVIFGAGGVGSNAVQGAAYAGAKNVIVVDPVAFKLEMAKVFGATHTFADPQEAAEFVVETTWGQLADHAIITAGVVTEDVSTPPSRSPERAGKVTITAIGQLTEKAVHVHAGMLVGYQRQVRGALFGNCNPLSTSRGCCGLYRAGELKLDELITSATASTTSTRPIRTCLPARTSAGIIVHDDYGDRSPAHRDSPGRPSSAATQEGSHVPTPSRPHRAHSSGRRAGATLAPRPADLSGPASGCWRTPSTTRCCCSTSWRSAEREHGAETVSCAARRRVRPADARRAARGCLLATSATSSSSASATADRAAPRGRRRHHFERAGVPAAVICSDAFTVTASAMAQVQGAPDYALSPRPTPSRPHPRRGASGPTAAPRGPGQSPVRAPGDDPDRPPRRHRRARRRRRALAMEHCYEQGWTDGLPLVPATRPLSTSSSPRRPVARRRGHRGAAADRPRGHRRARRHQRRHGGMPARVLPGRARRLGGPDARARDGWRRLAVHQWARAAHHGQRPGPRRAGIQRAGGVFGPGFRPNATIARAIGLIVRNAFGILPTIWSRPPRAFRSLVDLLRRERGESPWPPLSVDSGCPGTRSRDASAHVRVRRQPAHRRPRAAARRLRRHDRPLRVLDLQACDGRRDPLS